MKQMINWKLVLVGVICSAFLLGGILLREPDVIAAQKSKSAAKREGQIKAFQVYQQKCLGCHDSVADPEKPGRTRDDWHLIINIMHDYGLDLTEEQGEQIIDLLYDLRRGLEREAG
ncbi:MAG: cytochrome c [Deltaproteobacteria bacterium]|nr:cytochrome c [Deltaproteobacteria bacterium]MBW2705344.1 cytochrome c [Deltaproteobacteria bacterium]